MRGKVIADVFKILSWLRLITFHNNLLCQISSHDVTEIRNEKLTCNTSDETEITEILSVPGQVREADGGVLHHHRSVLSCLLDQYQLLFCFSSQI